MANLKLRSGRRRFETLLVEIEKRMRYFEEAYKEVFDSFIDEEYLKTRKTFFMRKEVLVYKSRKECIDQWSGPWCKVIDYIKNNIKCPESYYVSDTYGRLRFRYETDARSMMNLVYVTERLRPVPMMTSHRSDDVTLSETDLNVLEHWQRIIEKEEEEIQEKQKKIDSL